MSEAFVTKYRCLFITNIQNVHLTNQATHWIISHSDIVHTQILHKYIESYSMQETADC